MPSILLAVAFDARTPAEPARFWADLLGRDVVEDAYGLLLPGEGTQLGLRFVASAAQKSGPNPTHLHLTSADTGQQQATVQRAVGLGARHVDVGQRPEEGHVVLADPAGNEFCVIEAGNGWLAGCGFLGELACDGTRDVGLFWSAALGWPLVWDQDGETAVQSPGGGTKVAWGGPPIAPTERRKRQRLHLLPGEGGQEAEVARLVSLGAVLVGAGEHDVAVLADPDGSEFWVLPD